MDWQKNVVDILIFVLLGFSVYFIVFLDDVNIAVILFFITLGLSVFRKAVYDLFDWCKKTRS